MRIAAPLLAVVFSVLALHSGAAAAASGPAPDYGDQKSWLCLPGRTDPCSGPLTSTVVGLDGTFERRTYQPDANAPVDCFYVYPTVSREASPNADMTAGDEERHVAVQQLARFGTHCKLYAPLYRQITIAGLRGMGGIDQQMPYADVLSAWNTYLARYNGGRGVVLIGHSQGADILRRLIAEQIDGKPIQSRLISAIIPGARVLVPPGRDVGGSFQHVPLCRRAAQTGCVIAYSTFLVPPDPPSDAFFGRSSANGDVDACVNPAQLDGTSALDADFPPLGPLTRSLGTTFIETPGQLTASCIVRNGLSVLAVTPIGGPQSAVLSRTLNDLQNRLPGWGLHVLDVNIALGDLVDLVGKESAAWLRK